MKHLCIDIETKSSVDIGKAGAYKYAQSEDFEVLLFAYAWDDEEVEIVDLAQGERIYRRSGSNRQGDRSSIGQAEAFDREGTDPVFLHTV